MRNRKGNRSRQNIYSQDDKDVLKERLNTFYKCRDLEITNLWQRSVFLGAFLLLCFSGYGYMLFSSKSCCYHTNICGVSLAVVGQAMSIIWILMGKGSKRWYEVYESVICDIEKEKALKIPKIFQMGEYCNKQDTNESIFSLSAGKYSPSKLNICIGYVSLYVWYLIFCIHGGNLLRENFACLGYFSFAVAFSFSFMAANILTFVLEKYSRSSC